ncbi:general odorant-binding protein 19d [Drosophila grimshawi]|uniref:GH17929 n=1 Tax=Drosophila grimshawi TaxID=7222 RepID=B4JXD2_DROGR|nr:general odorant-binding protein 19d [Drosophila grimshawi]EDV95408.1 GH17929 [Drosophila grimshawi]
MTQMEKQQQHTWLSVLLVLACAGAWLSLVHAEDDDSMTLQEVVEMIEPFGQGCDPKPEQSHFEEMVLNKEDASHESKCLRRCLLKQFDLMPEGTTQFNEAKTNEMMNMMFSDKEDQSKIIMSKCNLAVTDVSDECEVAHFISMCMLNEMRNADYKIPNIKE